MKPTRATGRNRRKQQGVAAVEFAIVAGLFFTLLIGVMEMGRVLFYWSSATEATRLGARAAAVCDIDDGAIKAKMTAFFPLIGAEDIEVHYTPAGCTVANCDQVTVGILPGVTVNTVIPLVPLSIPLPPFSTSLPRESLLSSVEGIANPVCQ